jgi:hypothetical protein
MVHLVEWNSVQKGLMERKKRCRHRHQRRRQVSLVLMAGLSF